MNKKLKEFKVHFLEEVPSNDNAKEEIKQKIGIKQTKNTNSSIFPKIIKPILAGGGAFVCAILCIVFVLGVVNYQKIPVYMGMTAENVGYRVNLSGESQQGYIDNEIGVVIDESIVCYAKPGEEIIISINLYNPKEYEIISFVLNGKKYQISQFLEGSNSHVIKVKYIVQETSGLEEIEINEIKYIEGDTIKLARFQGDKTIKLGITFENKTSVSINNEQVVDNSVKISVDILDSLEEIKDKVFKMYLFDENKLISSKTLKVGTNEVEFKELLLNSKYYYTIVGVYDLYDGLGKKAQILFEDMFETIHGLCFSYVMPTYNSVSFEYNYLEGFNIQIKEVGIYLENELVSKLTNFEEYRFDNLLSNTTYEIITTYEYSYETNGETVVITDSISNEFKTEELTAPIVTLPSAFPFYGNIFVEVRINDAHNIVKEVCVELYLNGELVHTITEINDLVKDETTNISKGNVTFTNLEKGEYLLVVKYKYNLNDGKEDIVVDKDTDKEVFDIDNKLTVTLN